jgi:hypothetical protein
VLLEPLCQPISLVHGHISFVASVMGMTNRERPM